MDKGFLKRYFAEVQKDTARQAVSRYLLELHANQQLANTDPDKVTKAVSEWRKMYHTPKWRGYAIKTVSCLASYTGERQASLRQAYHVLVAVAREVARRKANDRINLLMAAGSGILPKEKEAILKAYEQKAEEKLSEILRESAQYELPF